MALNFRKFIEGLRIVPKAASTASEKGDLDVTLSDGKLNYHNGTSAYPIVTEEHSATLKNKTIDADSNTISNIENDNIKVGADIERAKLAAGTASAVIVNDASGVLSDLSLTSAQIIVGDASGIPTAVDISGDITLADDGAVTVDEVGGKLAGEIATSVDDTQAATELATADTLVKRDGSGDFASKTITSETALVVEKLLSTKVSTLTAATTLSPLTSFVNLTIGSSSIDKIDEGSDGQHLILTNKTGSSLVIQDQFESAATDIITGTGGDISLENNASLHLVYDGKWYVVGGVGGAATINLAGSDAGVVVGSPVYIDASGDAQIIDAGDDSKVEFVGIALDAGGGAVRVQVSGEVSIPSASFTVGGQVFVDADIPGELIQTAPSTAGKWIVPVGIATSSTKMVVNGAGSATVVKITSEVDQFIYASVAAVSTTSSLTNGNSIVLATGGVGGITLTLPSPTSGKIFNIKKVDADVGTITVDTTSGLIDGSANKVISSQYDSLTITSDGSNFYLI